MRFFSLNLLSKFTTFVFLANLFYPHLISAVNHNKYMYIHFNVFNSRKSIICYLAKSLRTLLNVDVILFLFN